MEKKLVDDIYMNDIIQYCENYTQIIIKDKRLIEQFNKCLFDKKNDIRQYIYGQISFNNSFNDNDDFKNNFVENLINKIIETHNEIKDKNIKIINVPELINENIDYLFINFPPREMINYNPIVKKIISFNPFFKGMKKLPYGVKIIFDSGIYELVCKIAYDYKNYINYNPLITCQNPHFLGFLK